MLKIVYKFLWLQRIPSITLIFNPKQPQHQQSSSYPWNRRFFKFLTLKLPCNPWNSFTLNSSLIYLKLGSPWTWKVRKTPAIQLWGGKKSLFSFGPFILDRLLASVLNTIEVVKISFPRTGFNLKTSITLLRRMYKVSLNLPLGGWFGLIDWIK